MDILLMMAQRFQACRLQRSVQGFLTDLSTETGAPFAAVDLHRKMLVKSSTKGNWSNFNQSLAAFENKGLERGATMFSTGGSTLIVEKIQPVETRACEGIVEWVAKDMRQVVHI
ncbi:hypothetical protein [Pseudomonas alloputida]|uniref:hypothetical protein n=1 Tax=Pseudomonas TaxID=286 RepID=UPI003EF06AC3